MADTADVCLPDIIRYLMILTFLILPGGHQIPHHSAVRFCYLHQQKINLRLQGTCFQLTDTAIPMSNYFNIGKIVATFGLQGEVILLHKTGTADALTGIKVLFIEEKKNSFLPWFIESVKVKNTEDLYLKLEGVDTREAARELIGKQVYLDEKNFAEKVNPDSVLYLLGFTVEDSQAGPLGAVAEVVEMPNGLLLKIYQNDHELLIPLNESTLQRMDRKSRTIYVRLPDGLLDIYRS